MQSNYSLHNDLRALLGGDLPHRMVINFIKSLIALDTPEEAIVEEYTEGGKSGIIEARLCIDGQYSCEYTGTIYMVHDPSCNVALAACLQELSRNAAAGERARAFARSFESLAVSDDDYVVLY